MKYYLKIFINPDSLNGLALSGFMLCRFILCGLMLCILMLCGLMFPSIALSAPGDILYENSFDRRNDLTRDFNRSDNSYVSVDSSTFNSASASVYFYSGPQDITLKSSRAIDTNLPAAELSVWIRRGDDSFSEDPDANEDFIVEYLSSANNWEILETFPGDGTPGEIFNRVYTLQPT